MSLALILAGLVGLAAASEEIQEIPGDDIDEFRFIVNDPDECFEPVKRQLGTAQKVAAGKVFPAIPTNGAYTHAYITSGLCQDYGYEDVLDLTECTELMKQCYYKDLTFINEIVTFSTLPPGCWPFTPDFYYSFIRQGGVSLLSTFAGAVPELERARLACADTDTTTPRAQEATPLNIGPCDPSNPNRNNEACDRLRIPSACSPMVPCYCRIPEKIRFKARTLASLRRGSRGAELMDVIESRPLILAAAAVGLLAAAMLAWSYKRKSGYMAVPEAETLAAA